jgi:acetyl esterase/lipase
MKKETNFGKEELSNEVQKIILNPDYAPLMVDDSKFVDLPLTYVLTAGYDVLRDDGLIYYLV